MGSDCKERGGIGRSDERERDEESGGEIEWGGEGSDEKGGKGG